jgi:alkylation response protein AidB-like acyl-CoA dehydrogenase
VHIALSSEEAALQRQADEYFSTVVTPAERAGLHEDEFGRAYRAICARLGRDGWLGLGWPTEYGGRGLDPMADQIVVSTAFRHHVPYPLMAVYSIGPALQAFGSAEHKARFLPRILSGEMQVAIGYSEAGAGTDLAALTTSARRDGDHYLVNGQKMFTSGVHTADFIWLACRTDSDEARHRGISILMVDMSLPGVSWTPIRTLNRARQVGVTYFDDVGVPVEMLVGEENRGWKLITSQLNSERFIVGPSGKLQAHFDRFLRWAGETRCDDGRRMSDIPSVRRALSEISAMITTNELLNWRIVADTGAGELRPADASANKIYNSERLLEVGHMVAEIVHRYGDPGDAATAGLLRDVDRALKSELKLPVGGGVNEIQRELVAVLGLGLPRAPR